MNIEDIKAEEKDFFKSLDYYYTISQLGNTDIGSVETKGSVLKEKLLILKGSLISEIEHCIRKMSKLVDIINEKPAAKCESMPTLFKYTYEQIYKQDGDGSYSNNPEDIKRGGHMREYNNHLYSFIDKKKNLEFLNKMIENIKDNKEYKLPIRLAEHLEIEL